MKCRIARAFSVVGFMYVALFAALAFQTYRYEQLHNFYNAALIGWMKTIFKMTPAEMQSLEIAVAHATPREVDGFRVKGSTSTFSGNGPTIEFGIVRLPDGTWKATR